MRLLINFVGLGGDQIGSASKAQEAMGLSKRTVELEWTMAKAWMRKELESVNET